MTAKMRAARRGAVLAADLAAVCWMPEQVDRVMLQWLAEDREHPVDDLVAAVVVLTTNYVASTASWFAERGRLDVYQVLQRMAAETRQEALTRT